MSEPSVKENHNGDLRWLLLALIALFIAAGTPLSRIAKEVMAPWIVSATPPTPNWSGVDWRWCKQGIRGEGLYLESAGKTGIGRQTEVDPRLAIFTYRPIDLNRVDAEALQTIRGVGPKLAGAIVAYRLSHGPFRSLDELLFIKGIGSAKLANLRGKLIVSRMPD